VKAAVVRAVAPGTGIAHPFLVPRLHRSLTLCASLLLVAACSDDDAAPPAPAPAPPPVTPAAPEPATAPSLACVEDDVAGSLARIEGVKDVAEMACGAYVRGATHCYSFTFQQPVDHGAKDDGATFAQRVRLVHRGCNAPTTIMDNGYSLPKVLYELEPSVLFQTNTLDVEHRYQGKSIPKGKDRRWSALSIENGAADTHALITALRPFYTNRWVSTGASKGGITAVYHRHLHPSDVDGTIAYVAPASRAREDARYQERMDTGPFPAACRSDVRAFQVAALGTQRAPFRAELQSRYGVSEEEGDYYLELLVGTFEWGFWQYLEDCGAVPKSGATDASYLTYFRGVLDKQDRGGAPAPSETEVSNAALAYEWSWQQGFAKQAGAHLGPYLHTQAIAESTNAARWSATFPSEPLPAFDGTETDKARDWVRTSAERLVLVYGEIDPWSGGALDAPTQTSSARFFVPQRSHGAQISDLPKADHDRAIAATSAMYGVSAQARSTLRPAPLGLHDAFLEHETRTLRALAGAHRSLRRP